MTSVMMDYDVAGVKKDHQNVVAIIWMMEYYDVVVCVYYC